jgi:hypothetical protein
VKLSDVRCRSGLEATRHRQWTISRLWVELIVSVTCGQLRVKITSLENASPWRFPGVRMLRRVWSQVIAAVEPNARQLQFGGSSFLSSRSVIGGQLRISLEDLSMVPMVSPHPPLDP